MQHLLEDYRDCSCRYIWRPLPLAMVTAGLMVALALAIFMAVLVCSPAARAEEPKEKPLTIAECQVVLAGLRGLDGRQEVVKDTAVTVPYQFNSARLRLIIQQNIARLSEMDQGFTKVQQELFREVAGSTGTEIKPNTAEMVRYQKLVLDAQQQPCGVALQKIRAEDLKLDKNEIPGSVLGALDKILDR